MSTVTKPRPRTISTARRAAPMMPSAEIITAIRKEIATNKRQITAIMREEGVNRSTRDQRAMRKKAQFRDRVEEILAGE